jgi:hypothetical protein
MSTATAAAAADFTIPRKKPRLVAENQSPKARVLVLFSGTKSVTRSLHKYFPTEYDAVSVDLDPTHHPTHNVNILEWDYTSVYKKGDFDYIWARYVI